MQCEAVSSEKKMMSGLIYSQNDKKDILFYELKGTVDTLLNEFGISDVWYDNYEASPEDSSISIWHPKKMAEIKSGNEEIGFIGEISLKVIEGFGIKGKVLVKEKYSHDNLVNSMAELYNYFLYGGKSPDCFFTNLAF